MKTLSESVLNQIITNFSYHIFLVHFEHQTQLWRLPLSYTMLVCPIGFKGRNVPNWKFIWSVVRFEFVPSLNNNNKNTIFTFTFKTIGVKLNQKKAATKHNLSYFLRVRANKRKSARLSIDVGNWRLRAKKITVSLC